MRRKLGVLVLLAFLMVTVFSTVSLAADTPTLTVVAPKVVYSPSATITAKASGQNPLKYLTVNKNHYALPGTKSIVKSVKVNLKAGSNIFTVKVVDHKGKYTLRRVYIVYLDKTPPVLMVTAPSVVTNSTADLKITAWDISRVAKLEVNGKNLLAAPVWYYQTVAKVNLNPGENTVTVKAVDIFGNATVKSLKIIRRDSSNTPVEEIKPGSVLSFDYRKLSEYPDVNTYTLNLKPGEEIGTLQISGIPAGISTDFGYKPAGSGKIYAIKEFNSSNISGEKLYFRYGSGSYYLLFYKQSWGSSVYIEKVIKLNVTGIADKSTLLPSGFVDSDNPTIRQIAYDLTKDLTSDLEKVKAIHDYVARALAYDWTSYRLGVVPQKTASEALASGTGVCQDYSRLFAAIARAAGIPTKIVIGTGDGEPHAWNRVYVNGKWLDVDVTWDDQEKYGIIYDYFLKEAPLPKHVEDSSAEAYYEAEMLHSITFEE
ncbi:transglutaminase domain-containing protein [Carboxydothermus hydrogenoformans]|uniref:Transglutaminase family protein n=1 Tax=Carboxydothermus hydrogenoformans (strain ATCC BAA-161 / DSM 6008 / Z-2901) TaxID=246194 RepID=Q3A9A4_CARHZ|nr:transglutaminase-like domain-containing protein [Carboxydothermus hydrogenoformans]ABB15759.1 transglutaminase family protein [Carboxydothermus hydrogenoformans Z-2901]